MPESQVNSDLSCFLRWKITGRIIKNKDFIFCSKDWESTVIIFFGKHIYIHVYIYSYVETHIHKLTWVGAHILIKNADTPIKTREYISIRFLQSLADHLTEKWWYDLTTKSQEGLLIHKHQCNVKKLLANFEMTDEDNS